MFKLKFIDWQFDHKREESDMSKRTEIEAAVICSVIARAQKKNESLNLTVDGDTLLKLLNFDISDRADIMREVAAKFGLQDEHIDRLDPHGVGTAGQMIEKIRVALKTE